MKKKLFFGLLAAAGMLLAASCSNDELETPALSGDESVVSFTLEQPGIATRAYSNGESATKLSYAVYESGDTTPLITLGDGDDGQVEFTNKTATVNLRLVNGKTYDIIFWADNEAAPYTFNAAATEEAAAQTVTVNYTSVASQDETLDAFYAATTLKVEGASSQTIQLKRPFAQMNIATTDAAAAKTAGYVPTQSKLTVTSVYSTLNLLDGTVSDATSVTYAYAALPGSDESFPVTTEGTTYTYLSMNYLLVEAEVNVDIEIAVKDEAESNEIVNNYYNVPVQRNYKTNLYGALLTESTDITVEIVPDYAGTDYDCESDTYLVKDEVTVEGLSFSEEGVATASVAADATEYTFNITTADENTAWTVTSDNEAFSLSSTSSNALTKSTEGEEAVAEEETEQSDSSDDTSTSTAAHTLTGTGNATVYVKFSANTTTEDVTANIVITAGETTRTITLTQAAKTYTPTATIDESVTATTSSLTYSVTLTDATGYYYKLVASSEEVTAETLQSETLNEVGETNPVSLSIADLTANTAYTLYVLPVYASDGADTVYGEVASLSATTAKLVASAEITAGTATYNSLPFTVALTNATGYYYMLVATPADEDSAPTADDLKGTDLQETTTTELTLEADADGTSLTEVTEYTLYVLPVNGEDAGEIVSAALSTTYNKSSLYSCYTYGGETLTIADVEYSYSANGAATLLTASDADVELYSTIHGVSGIFFLKSENSCKFTISTAANITSLVLIGDDPDALTTVQSTTNHKLNSGYFVMYNINLDTNNGTSQIVNLVNASSDIDKLHIDGCEITNMAGPILWTGGSNYNNIVKSIKVVDSSIQITSTAGIQLFNFAATTDLASITDITFDNNIVYNSTGLGTLQLFNYNTTTQTGSADIQLTNNTFVNSPGPNIYVKFYSIATLNCSNNIFYIDQSSNTSATNVFCTYMENEAGSSYSIANNYYYNASTSGNCNMFYTSSTYINTSYNPTVLSESPFTTADCTNGTFTQSTTYASYGAQR